ncbi:MAG: AIR synthase-related protein, partial [Actinomycetota bacterium]
VQVGDPFTEKLLIEASLELIDGGAIAGLQDLGAGGISCPVSEMAAKGRTGVLLDVGRVHLREPGMEAFEIMISESQERMLAVVDPRRVGEVVEVCSKWGLDAAVIGEVTKSGRVEVSSGDERVAGVPANALAEEGPVYDRPAARPGWIDELRAAPAGGEAPGSLEEALLLLLGSPNIASKRWIWEQYDHMIFLGTVAGPGGDAAVIRLPGRDVGVALSTDGPGRYCLLDPYEGARLAVAEAARNVACTGARPVAVTNCLNLGNPERPEVMWQFAEVVRGLGDACRDLGTPVTGGNVSFYNETSGRAIHPTPVVGMLGVLDDVHAAVGVGFGDDGDAIVVLGDVDPSALGGSEYAEVVNGRTAGVPPRLHIEREAALHRLLHAAAGDRLVASAHDVSKGGLAVALVEAALAGGRGFSADVGDDHRSWFSESPSRAVVSCRPDRLGPLLQLARSFGVSAHEIGRAGGDALDLGAVSVGLERARAVHEDGFPSALSARVERSTESSHEAEDHGG